MQDSTRQTVEYKLEKPDNLIRLFSRALKPKTKTKQAFPFIRASIEGLQADPKKVADYSKVCGFGKSNTLPVTYPHIMAFPLHLKILTSDHFPYPLLGLVHVANDITQYRPINTKETLDITCSLTEQRQADKGMEFDIQTEASVDNETVWKSTSTMLKRDASKSSGSKSAPTEAVDYGAEKTDHWVVPANIGRRYARVSGDFNFIHLHKISAMLFGFNNAIAHGMWSKARTIASLENELPKGPFTVSIKFKLPMFLPAKVQLMSKGKAQQGLEFQLMDNKGEKPHLAGTVTPISN